MMAKHMKFVSFIALIAIVVLAGCSSDESAQASAAETDAAVSAQEEPAPAEQDAGEEPAADETAQTVAAMPSFQTVEDIGMTFSWAVDGDELEIELSGPTTGWIAVGFKPSRMMKDANILIGYVDGSGATMTDQFGTTMTAHRPDADLGGSEDVTVLSGEESDGTTTIRFRIPLDSGDEYDQPLAAGEEMRVILAYGENGADNTSAYHADRSGVDITL